MNDSRLPISLFARPSNAILMTANSRRKFKMNSYVYNTNTRKKSHFHNPYQIYYNIKRNILFGTKVFNPYPANVEKMVSS